MTQIECTVDNGVADLDRHGDSSIWLGNYLLNQFCWNRALKSVVRR
ncbi:MAG TPA: hypothetical protein VFH46_01470 [Pyrinomonadaceae bacterium]|nr:hypothetical protein [Pyrinomonadaceae bacterium]